MKISDLAVGDRVMITTGLYADRYGEVVSLHLREVGVEFDDGDSGTFSYYNITKEE